nr:angiopoietin-related protein 7-like [Drosophila takahashii]
MLKSGLLVVVLSISVVNITRVSGAKRCPSGREEGIYKINRTGMDLFEVPCNRDGWMIIQRRQDGSVDFNRTWQDYKNGFGNLKGEFFLGLEKLHQLTKKPQELYVKLVDFQGNSRYATFDNFEVGSEEELYVLKSVGSYYGNAGDALSSHVNKKFSTAERDNDNSVINCASYNSGGWWFDDCLESSLNGKYIKSHNRQHNRGIHWTPWHNYYNSLAFVEMMIRPKYYYL